MFQAHQIADLVEQFFCLPGRRLFPHDRSHASVYNGQFSTSGLDGIIPQLNAKLFRLLLVRRFVRAHSHGHPKMV
jgi:hypothetical protein